MKQKFTLFFAIVVIITAGIKVQAGIKNFEKDAIFKKLPLKCPENFFIDPAVKPRFCSWIFSVKKAELSVCL